MGLAGERRELVPEQAFDPARLRGDVDLLIDLQRGERGRRDGVSAERGRDRTSDRPARR